MKRYLFLIYLIFCFASSTFVLSQVEPTMTYRLQRDPECKAWVDSVFNKLSTREKVSQLFVYTIAPTQTKANLSLLNQAVTIHKVGALLFSGGELSDQAYLINEAQSKAKVPLMITFDGEWGLAMRLKNTPRFPRNGVLGAIQEDQLLFEYGKEVARQCKELGVHVNFAPVADVNINPKNPVINTRSFGEITKDVADKVVLYSSGLESGGVLSVSKHFPGHGDTETDSHHSLPYLPFTKSRLDSVELYPFKRIIDSGLGGIMVGHLEIPALELQKGLPSSLSRSIVTGLLKEELGFKGLVFTDALAMKGAAAVNPSLQAIKAGNDMVLTPSYNIKKEIDAVMKALDSGDITLADIEEKCKKVLTFKYALGLSKEQKVKLSGLQQRINTPEADTLIKKLHQAAVVLVTDHQNLLPLPQELEQLAWLHIGKQGEEQLIKKELPATTDIHNFNIANYTTAEKQKQLLDTLSTYRRIVISATDASITNYTSFFKQFNKNIPATLLLLTDKKLFEKTAPSLHNISTLIWGQSDRSEVKEIIGKALIGKATLTGKLPFTIDSGFVAGQGVNLKTNKPYEALPKELGFDEKILSKIDSIVLDAIKDGAFPGCQILVLKEGIKIYDKNFGTETGAGSNKITSNSLFDIASLTKTSATLLAMMKLYDKGLYNLTDKISQFLPYLKGTNKENITIRELLLHESGLIAGLPIYLEVVDQDSYPGRLLSVNRSARHTIQLGSKLWGNPNFKFKKEWISNKREDPYLWTLGNRLWLNYGSKQLVLDKIIESPLRSKSYRYSCLGFILLHQMVEELVHMPMDQFLNQEFYHPMGLEHIAYQPLKYFSKDEITPSNNDRFLRKTELRGEVHDELAAFMGGVSGNAGLFSNADNIASIHQMILNKGEWKGKRYLSQETCRLFTTTTSRSSRRGLGFDKPTKPTTSAGNPCASEAPLSTYGHTGFTGTCAWVDPDNELVYVFLSNRTYPNVYPNKLYRLNVREKVQQVIYQSFIHGGEIKQ